jgi:chitin disaccharide deacetylase
MGDKFLPPGLIVNADDLGIHPAINAGILSAYRNGILTSCTMLMTTAYLDETLRDFVRPAALPIGVHLSLTLGKAAADAAEIPDLVDEEGNLKLSAARLLLSSHRDAVGHSLLRQIRREFEAQLGRALDCGLKPTHADSHQHVHMSPPIFDVLQEVLPRFGIDRLRFSRERFWTGVFGAEFLPIVKRLNPAKWALIRWRSAQITPHLAANDELFGVLYSGVISKAAMLAVIEDAGLDRSIEICIHPGFPAPSGVQHYTQHEYNAFISSILRKREHDVLVDADVQAAIRRRGLKLRSYDGELKH